MAKKVTGIIKLQIPAGKATPAPPVGPALGQHGVNIMQFCKDYNAKTEKQAGLIIPVVITVYQDNTFTFITKTPPTAVLIKKNTEPRIRIEQAQRRQSRHADKSASGRDSEDENAGSERGKS